MESFSLNISGGNEAMRVVSGVPDSDNDPKIHVQPSLEAKQKNVTPSIAMKNSTDPLKRSIDQALSEIREHTSSIRLNAEAVNHRLLQETAQDVEKTVRTVLSSGDELIKCNSDGSVKVYPQRWVILGCFCLAMFTWNLHASRHIGLVPEFARYFDTTNEAHLKPDQELGIDFFTFFDGIVVIVLYPISGVLVDTYGLRMMKVGTVLQAVACWWWFGSYQNFNSVIAAHALGQFGGTLFASCYLRVAANWFSVEERPIAVGIGFLAAGIGGALAVVFSPLFHEHGAEQLIDVTLKSCKIGFREEFELVNNNETDALPCTSKASDNFCCYFPTNIDDLNLFMSILASIVAIITCLKVVDEPPTPPSGSAHTKKSPGAMKGFLLMFKNANYAQLCVADFLTSAPPLVLFGTMSRLFSQDVEQLVKPIIGVCFVFAIPLVVLYGRKLSKNKLFYEMTVYPYTAGLIIWVGISICAFIDILGTRILGVILGGAGIIAFSLWSAAVFELKMEYIFDPDYNLEGYVVAVDRALMSASGSLFVLLIAPEKFNTTKVEGRTMTYLVGALIMFIGVILAWTICDKHKYKRMPFEDVALATESKLPFYLQIENVSKINHERKAGQIQEKPKEVNPPMSQGDIPAKLTGIKCDRKERRNAKLCY